jgi:hypothetical protein
MNTPSLEPEAQQEKFEKACKDGELYQVQIPELNIMTSVDSCFYSVHGGLNETFVVTSVNGKQLSAIHYDVVDLEFLASREKSAKRRRLTLTPDFSSWKTTVLVKSNHKGAVKPFFYPGLKLFNSMGGERVERRKDKGDGKKGEPQEDNRSWIGKNWMYIAMGIWILSKFIDVSEPAQPGQEGAQGAP